MKIYFQRQGFLWQATTLFLILLDGILLLLSAISNLKLLTLQYMAGIDLVVSVVLFIFYMLALFRAGEKTTYIRKNWFLIFSFIPIYIIALYNGHVEYPLMLKLLSIIKILSLYLFAQKFAKSVLKYQEKTRLVYALSLFLLVLFICSFIFYAAENPVNPEVANYEDSLWFVLQTITTVGYGDIIPVTGVGRVMGVISMLSALVLTSIITSVATFSLIEKFKSGTEQLTKVTRERVEDIDKKLSDINIQLKELDNLKDLEELKKDIKEMKSDMDSIKELLEDKN